MSIINSESVKPVRSSGQKRQWKVAAIVVLVAAGLGTAAYPYLVPQSGQFVLKDYDTALVIEQDLLKTAQASGTVQIPTQMIVSAPSEGFTYELNVSVGDFVSKGDVIGTLDVPDLDDDISDLQSSLISAELTVDRTRQEFENQVENSEADIAELEQDISELQADVETYRKLVAINSARQTELDALVDELADAQTNLSAAERSLRQARALYVIDMNAAEATLSQIETELTRALADREEANLKSPMTGEILEIEDVMSVAGSTVEKGDQLFTIADPNSAIFDLEISEEYANAIAIGDTVPVTVGSSIINGEISFIGKVAQTSSDGLGATIQVEVTPEVVSDSLLLGSTAIGVFTLGVETDALTLPRGSYLTTGSQKYIYVIDGDQASKTQVTYGEIEGNTVQIASGLSAGDRVITSGYQNFISETTITLGE